jgi:hypothetical protein
MTPDVEPRPLRQTVVDGIVAAMTVALLASMDFAWFSAPWPGNLEFFSGTFGPFAGAGYPARYGVRLLLVVALVTLGYLATVAVARVMGAPRALLSPAAHRRTLLSLTALSLGLVAVALVFPPDGKVAFPAPSRCPGIYVALLAAAAALLATLFGPRPLRWSALAAQ